MLRRLLHRRTVLMLLLPLAVVGTMIYWHAGFHSIIGDQVYGSHQLSIPDMKEKIKEHQIRTVINLRGATEDAQWYQDEKAMAKSLGVEHYDFPLSSVFLPTPELLREVVQVVEACPRPVLIHCESGIDRTGLLNVICLLLEDPSVTPDTVLDHLPVWRGHLPWRKSLRSKRKFLKKYTTWLEIRSLSHTPVNFREWVCNDYYAPLRQ